MSQQHFDLAIIGGGMVGASLAIMLAKLQPEWRLALIESYALPAREQSESTLYQPSFDARSTAISAGSAEILEAAGLWSGLSEFAAPIKRVHVSDRGHFGGTQLLPEDHGLDALGYVLENACIGQVLMTELGQIGNIDVIAPATVARLQPQAGGASIHFADERGSLDVALAIVADGVNSPLRRALGIDASEYDYQQRAIVANVSLDRPHQDIAYERFTDQGPMALLPLSDLDGHHRYALVWTMPEAEADEVLGLNDKAFCKRLQERFGHRAGQFVGVGERISYPLQLTQAAEQIRSNIVLMGNAAHFLHPVAGQGFNLALRDCANLSAVLAADGRAVLGSVAQLQRYLHVQALDQKATIGFSDLATRVFSSSRWPLAVLRQLGLLSLELLPGGDQGFARQAMGKGMAQGFTSAMAKRAYSHE